MLGWSDAPMLGWSSRKRPLQRKSLCLPLSYYARLNFGLFPARDVGGHRRKRLQQLGHQINLPTNGLIRIVARPVLTPFDARTLDTNLSIPPSELQAIGRRKSTGLVVARRHPNEFLLRNEDDTISRVELQEPSPPAIGDFVEVAGNVETDIHNLNFSRALWRKASAKELPAESAPTLTARQVLFNEAGQPFVQIKLQGFTLVLRSPDDVTIIAHPPWWTPVRAPAGTTSPRLPWQGTRQTVPSFS